MRNIRLSLAASLSLSLVACTTVDGERPGFLQTMQQVVGAASMVVGAQAGDTNFAQQGANMFQQGLGAGPTGNQAMTSEYRPSPAPASPRPVSQGSAGSADCMGYLRSQYRVMSNNARTCQANEAAMSSIESEGTPLKCTPQLPPYIDQRTAQQACGVVYMCAMLAYREAMREAQAGADCQAALQRGLARHPIPKSQ